MSGDKERLIVFVLPSKNVADNDYELRRFQLAQHMSFNLGVGKCVSMKRTN